MSSPGTTARRFPVPADSAVDTRTKIGLAGLVIAPIGVPGLALALRYHRADGLAATRSGASQSGT